jgi:hypothetical protein
MKKYIAAIFTILLVFCISTSTAYSNSPPLVMIGDTAFPISHDHIKLESEIIKIHYGSKTTDEWMIGHEVEVLFNFHNLRPETDLDIGFPNVASYAEKLRDFQAMDYPSLEPYTTEIKAGSTLPDHDIYMYSSMYTWKMHFKENEKKSLYVKYWFENESRNPSADYILVTGALWKDRIEKIDVYVDFPKPVPHPFIFASPHNYYYNGEGIEWHFENIEPDFNLLVNYTKYPPSFELKDEYYRPRDADPHDSYLWDDYFYWIDTFPNEFEMAELPLHEFREMERIRKIVGYIKNTNQYVVNEIYSRNGYVFTAEKWKNLFGQALRYTPSLDFSVDKFNSIERFNLKYINEFDKTVSLDDSDEDLVKSLENFINKYRLDHKPYYNRYYYKHNYDELKKDDDYGYSPHIYDEIKASPGGNYIIAGTNYSLDGYSPVTRNMVYVASVNDGSYYTAGYGDFDDYRFWWSPSEKVFCCQNAKTEPELLKIFDTESGGYNVITLPEDRIDDLEITEDMKIAAHCKDTIYFVDTCSTDTPSTEFHGTLLGINNDKVYFYKGEDIYCAEFDEPAPSQANKIPHSIWNTEKISENTYCLYGRASNLSVYNVQDNKIYHYKSLDYYGLIKQSPNYYGKLKPSPSGGKIYVYKDYFNIYGGMNIQKAFVVNSETGEETEVSGGDATAEWLDNDNLCVKAYDNNNISGKQAVMEYEFNTLTGRRTLTESSINTFKSRTVQEFETGMHSA